MGLFSKAPDTNALTDKDKCLEDNKKTLLDTQMLLQKITSSLRSDQVRGEAEERNLAAIRKEGSGL